MTKSLEALIADMNVAAHEEIMCRENCDTSDRWNDEASPENVLTVIAALETQKKYYEIVISDGSKRIAELESRQLSVKLPDYRNSPDMHTKQYYEAVGFNQGLDAATESIRAAGGIVEGGE